MLRAKKVEGKTVFDLDRFPRLLARLSDGEYDVVVEKHVNRRSGQQNKAYRACIVRPCSESSGYHEDEVHELLKRFCNPKTVGILNKETGGIEDVTIGGSTTALNVEEFELYRKRCQQFAAEKWDCYCPDPNEEYMFDEQPKGKRRTA
jgi:hypothetical protein